MTPTARFDDETEAEHYAFMSWLLSKPRRAPSNPDLATRMDWATRAAMFDAQPPPGATTGPEAQPVETARNLQRLLGLETAKLLKLSESSPATPVLSPHELLRMVAILTGGGKVDLADTGGGSEAGGEFNYEDCTDEQLDFLKKVVRIR